MAKRRSSERRDTDESRISELPNNILQHILSFFSQKEAIRTCVLSKSWRHLAYTRPNVDLRESSGDDKDKELFLSALEKTLQTYQEQKQTIQDLRVEMSALDSKSSSIIGKLVKDMNVVTFRLALYDWNQQDFPLPRLIFQAESLTEIYLSRLLLSNRIDEKVRFEHLKTLHLNNCYIEEKIFAKIISSCPLIGYLVLDSCNQLETINHNHSISFKFNNHFLHLKSLYLREMRLSSESLHNLSSENYFPCLEELEINSCDGIEEEFVLSSRSIKRLIISDLPSFMSAIIDAPNILYFKVSNTRGLPPSISSTTTSKEWKSQIETLHRQDFFDANRETVSTCLLLKALGQSQISFKPYCPYSIKINDDWDFTGEPAVVEHLDLSSCFSSFPFSADKLIYFFRICRPRYVSGMCPGVTAGIVVRHCSGELASSCKSKIIIKDRLRNKQHCFWQQDLEELSCEIWDGNAKKWNRCVPRKLSCNTLCALTDKKQIRYQLKWRGEKTG